MQGRARQQNSQAPMRVPSTVADWDHGTTEPGLATVRSGPLREPAAPPSTMPASC